MFSHSFRSFVSIVYSFVSAPHVYMSDSMRWDHPDMFLHFMSAGLNEMDHPWIQDVIIEPPAAADPPVLVRRLRPLIYVYDLPPDYNSRLLQYRNLPFTCVYRL
jgi:hypothetical protein